MKKHIPTIARVLLGLAFIAGGLAGLLGKVPPPKDPQALAFMGALIGAKLLLAVKILEITCGVALVLGICAPLALVTLAAILFNIVFFQASLNPGDLPVGVILTALWITAAWGYRARFEGLLTLR